MILQTRYRDVPWEETQCPTREPEYWERERRGRSIRVEVPSAHNKPYYGDHRSVCHEPKYQLVNASGEHIRDAEGPFMACPHIAEIGD